MSGVDSKICLNGSLIYLSDPFLTYSSPLRMLKTGKKAPGDPGDFLHSFYHIFLVLQ